jgi:hypothetical protein
MAQRQNVEVAGGTASARKRPTTQLRDQKNAASASST